jgi:hypothetical protein
MHPSEIDEGGYELMDLDDPAFVESHRKWEMRYCMAIMGDCGCIDHCAKYYRQTHTTEVHDGLDIQRRGDD